MTGLDAFVVRIVKKDLEKKFAQYLVPGTSLIDIGCGTKPLGPLLAKYNIQHVGMDHPGTLHNQANIDLFGTAYEIPVANASFDNAACTAVLEHLEEPQLAINETARVLKAGALAFYTVPLFWHLHEEPRDFYRYTKYGLQHLFEKAGFEIVEITALSGFWITQGQMFASYLQRFKKGPFRWLGIISFLQYLVLWKSYWLDKLDKAEQWTWMYSLVARKK